MISRTKSANYFEFGIPTKGANGAELYAYEWIWKKEEYIDKRGEAKTKRVSNWEESISSEDTDRHIVHQFHIRTPDGKTKIVSAESAMKLLTNNSNKKEISSSINKAKSFAKLLLKQKITENRLKEIDVIVKMIESLPLPKLHDEGFVDNETREWRMDDAVVWEIGSRMPNISEERYNTLLSDWRNKRLEEQSTSHYEQYKLKNLLQDIERKINKYFT